MPLAKIEFAPGIVKDDTPLASEGGYVDADKVRFRQGRPETIRGWEIACPTKFDGIARGLHAWSDLRGQQQAAFGTANKLYAYSGGLLLDITPPHSEGALLNPFSTTSGSPTVRVNHTEHSLALGQSITFSHAAAVGGLTLNGTYTVSRIVSRNAYEITAASNATSTVANGGGGVDYLAPWQTNGLTDGTGGLGFGTGAYGIGPYGLPSVSDFLPTIWSLDNFGEILLAVRRNGALYAWQPAIAYTDLAAGGTWVGGTGWTPSATGGTKTAGTASNLSQNVQNAIEAGYTYRVTFNATVTAGSARFKMNAGSPAAVIDLGGPSTPITTSGTYSRTFVAPGLSVDAVFEADSTFAGSITGVTITKEAKAFRVDQAPTRIQSMFVDPNRVVVLLGTYEADGDYNPLLVRWSGQENIRTWIPDTDNIAGEQAVSSGGRLVGGIATRRQNLIWTDDGLHAMQLVTDGYSFQLLGTGCGLIGANGAAEHNGIVFWLSGNGNFYIFQGAIPQVITCRLREYVFERIPTPQAEKVYCGINAEFSEVWWFYPDDRDGLECSRYAVFNWLENHWTRGTMNRTAWAASGVFPYPLATGTDGYLYYHEKGTTANGMPLASFLETAYFDVDDGGNLMWVSRFVPDFQDQGGPITVTFTGKLWPNAVETMTRAMTAATTSRKCDFRLKARQVKMRLESQAAWRCGLLRLDAEKMGAKR